MDTFQHLFIDGRACLSASQYCTHCLPAYGSIDGSIDGINRKSRTLSIHPYRLIILRLSPEWTMGDAESVRFPPLINASFFHFLPDGSPRFHAATSRWMEKSAPPCPPENATGKR